MDYQFHLQAYINQGQITDAVEFILREFGLEHPNLRQIKIGHESQKDALLLTAEGEVGDPQTVNIPGNLLDFDPVLYLNMLAHEMLHVAQKSPQQMVEDKNEREWQAYYEMIFHEVFPQIPVLSNFHQKFFAQKALVYYARMGENSDLQQKYAQQKEKLALFLGELSI